ncbi:hypothetical protein ACH5RR_004636 [Cinchona calisaya]|uniref:Myb/SANT-like DNA-binding domain-containing protein n=1 Tax=Cinchona calisaya TaxID=153742 RepID=A0ABD3AY72_9GENT
MESNGMAGGGMYSNMGSGMVGLEMSLHHQVPQQNTHNTQQHMQQQKQQSVQPAPHPPIVSSFGHHENAHLPVKLQGYPFAGKANKNQSLPLSDDENSADTEGKRKMSPWQRMKWTDNMVRLLIMVVFYIGDEGAAGSDGNNIDPAGKNKKGCSGSAGGVLQKKGKWKSVSRAMMERGFFVSPQQCEDKFNDLNKRYKRVNDILGKGTACKVVENQNLLDSMDHLSDKMKDEVKKLLNSKHLFFREMCAYHNSCGHGGGAQQLPEVRGAEQSPSQMQQQQQRCLHSSENVSIAPNLVRGEVEGSKTTKAASGEEEEEDDDDEDDDDNDDDEDDEEDEDDVVEGEARVHHHGHHEDEDDTPDEKCSRKRQRKGEFHSPLIQQMSTELVNVFQDETKNPLEKRQWIRNRLFQLEQQHVGYQRQAFELEKQRLKWLKFSSKKEREMERDKLSNERMRLENERMALLIREKEIELLDLYHHPSRKSDPSSITG